MENLSLYTILFQIINFGILVYLMKRFCYQPLLSYLDKREQLIETDLNDAKTNREKSETLLAERDALLKAAYVDAKDIRTTAEEASKQEKQVMITAAKKESEQLLEHAQRDINLNVERSKNELMGELGQLTVSLTQRFLKGHLSEEDQKKIVIDYLEKTLSTTPLKV